MENASDALKMAFAVFIFVFALSLAFSTITQAKETADLVLFANDKTNYYEYVDIDPNVKGRIVGIETVISTINRCKNETMVVSVLDKNGNPVTIEIDGNTENAIFDSSEDQGGLNNKIKKFIENNMNDSTYLEQFVEAKYSGKEMTASDGSSIIITKGGTKMFITYTMQ